MFFKMEHCDVYYGQIQALYDINVEINPGEIISIIGANGAGKTTHEEHHGPRPRQERQDRLAG